MDRVQRTASVGVWSLALAISAHAGTVAATFTGTWTADEKANANQACKIWQNIITDANLNVTIDFSFAAMAGSTASTTPLESTGGVTAGGGVAGDLFKGFAKKAKIEMNNTAGFFFVDPTPQDSLEFTPKTTADPNGFDDANPYYFRNFLGGAGDAKNKFDMLSVMIHEVGHAIGFDGDFEKFRTPMGGLFGKNDNNNLFTSSTLGFISLEGDGLDGAGNNDTSPANAINELSHYKQGIYPGATLAPANKGVGWRIYPSALDVDMFKAAYGFTNDYSKLDGCIPSPSALALLGVAGFGVTTRRRRAR